MKLLTPLTLAVIIAGLSAGLQSLATPEGHSSDDSVQRIAYLTDLSGAGAYWGRYGSLGVQLAVEEQKNAGRQVELFIGDHRFQTRTAVTEAQKAIHANGADAIIVDFTPQAVAVSSIAKQSKTLFINMSAATSVLKTNPYAITAYLNYEKNCRDIALYWKSKGIRNVGMLRLNAEFAELCFRGAKAVYPELFVKAYDFGDTVTTHLLAMKTRNIEAVFNTGLEGDTINMLKAMKSLDFVIPFATSRPDGMTAHILAEFSDAILHAVSFDFPAIDQTFIQRFEKAFPDHSTEHVTIAARAYAHAKQALEALVKCPKTSIECKINSLKNTPPDPETKFLGYKNRIANYNYELLEWDGNESSAIQ